MNPQEMIQIQKAKRQLEEVLEHYVVSKSKVVSHKVHVAIEALNNALNYEEMDGVAVDD